jgi:hypothetical protein
MALDKNGFVASSLATNTTAINNSLKAIYGDDIDLSSSSPDGQLANIFALAKTESQQIAEAVLASFDIDQAVGTLLDSRLKLIGLYRKGGTFTLQEIVVVVNQSITLQGLDSNINNPDGTGFTVQDNNGVQFILANTISLISGTHTLIFRSKNIGAVATQPNTITNVVDITTGVVSVNNPSSELERGIDQESDYDLKVRLLASRAINASGITESILANITAIQEVTDCIVLENSDDTVDSDGVNGHSIWAIVEGGADLDIANAIRYKLTPGTNTQGDVVVSIALTNRRSQIISFDRPISQSLYLRFNIKSTKQGQSFNIDNIKQYIVDNTSYNIFQEAETATLTQTIFNAISNTGGGGVPLSVQISSDNTTWVDYVIPTSPKHKFLLNATNITITLL